MPKRPKLNCVIEILNPPCQDEELLLGKFNTIKELQCWMKRKIKSKGYKLKYPFNVCENTGSCIGEGPVVAVFNSITEIENTKEIE